ncbi:hypothetical protein LCGC14_0650180 [marine sediment metagenome]|uniref:Uncharacterized protein n=1 Tax=marine sediment metagenome TaxID=412755 RepID=A0A0F9R1S8_9ZZZZ|nr:hypothetical protein [Candidatus Aminicenantes bacterium]
MARKKETQAQKMEKMIKKVLKGHQGTTVSNNVFTGIKFDAEIASTITAIAEGLIENAKGLRALSGFLKASSVSIGSLLEIGASLAPGEVEMEKGVRTYDTFGEEE